VSYDPLSDAHGSPRFRERSTDRRFFALAILPTSTPAPASARAARAPGPGC
jgi:hypothetical protein